MYKNTSSQVRIMRTEKRKYEQTILIFSVENLQMISILPYLIQQKTLAISLQYIVVILIRAN